MPENAKKSKQRIEDEIKKNGWQERARRLVRHGK
jgi:hypothetical protein